MTWKLGDMSVSKVFELDAEVPLPAFFSQVNTADMQTLKRWYWDEHLSDDPAESFVNLSFHSYIVQAHGKKILIDPCNGNHKSRPGWSAIDNLNTDFLGRFRATGIDPLEIDYVLCTHLHSDHVGWSSQLVNGEWVPTFPNARYLFSSIDYEFYKDKPDDKYAGGGFVDSVLPIVAHGLADMIDPGAVVLHEIDDGVWLERCPGHTPGGCLIHAREGGPQATFTGDLFHHPVQLVRPDEITSSDVDGVLGAKLRTAFFAEVAETDRLVFTAHFGRTSAGRVEHDGAAYRFEFLPE